MYLRMLFLFCISLYTSRIVLQTLGEEDYGTYNVVGSVVVLFSFINSAMTTGTQRHLSYELGNPKGNVGRIFSACFTIHLWLAGVIIILSETIGLWFVNTQLNFPDGRMSAVNWVYQFSIIGCVFNIIRVPFNALIIAYEKMSFYAYMGIIEGLFKLLIVFILTISPIDKLVLYSFLITLVIGTVSICFFVYCKICFHIVHFERVRDKDLYRKLLSFSGWTLFGSFANLARNQGVSFIINIFYGVTLNAAIGIANQVNSGISQFVGGFQQAFNPQLTKAEASQDRQYQQQLIGRTAKFSYLIILFVSLPVLYNLDYLLAFWLGNYPDYTASFCKWIVLASLIDSISGPLWVSIFATGKIKTYQIIISSFLLLSLPLAFLTGKLGWHPQYVFVFLALINLFAIFIRLYMLDRLIQFDIRQFINRVFVPIIVTSLLMAPIALIGHHFSCAQSFGHFILQSSIIVSYEFVVIALAGLTNSERNWIFKMISLMYKKCVIHLKNISIDR